MGVYLISSPGDFIVSGKVNYGCLGQTVLGCYSIHATFHDYYRHDGFLFKGKRLCVPMSSIRQLLVKEAREGCLMGHFKELKTVDILNEHFFWSPMRKNMHNICDKCLTCKMAKYKVSLHELYTPFPFPIIPWVDISMDFVLGLPRFKRGRNSIFVIVDKEVVRIHGLPKTIVSNRDSKFLGHFWRSLWSRLDTKLLYSTTCHP
ncbi:hypothetical protein CR513_17346, partial [Mucuna pruriens]